MQGSEAGKDGHVIREESERGEASVGEEGSEGVLEGRVVGEEVGQEKMPT